MSHDITQKQFIKIVFLVVILGVGVFIYDYVSTQVKFDGSLTRNNAGSGIKSEDLQLEIGDGLKKEKEDISVEISEVALDDDQIKAALDEAQTELYETYLGDNESRLNVQRDLNVKKKYADGLINAVWQFSDYSIVSTDGVINQTNVGSAGEKIKAQVELSYGKEKQIVELSFVVQQLDRTTKEGQKIAIERALKEADENNPTNERVNLPTEVSGQKLKWKRPLNYRGLKLALLGLIAVVGIQVGSKVDKKKLREEINAKKEKDYPLIVSELSILMGAGMSFRKALERISKKYVQHKRCDPDYEAPGYEEMLMTYRQIEDGVGEIQALENLSIRCDNKDYRKLSLLLIQNIKKGSKDLIYALEKEEVVAFEMRKQRAIRLGEEASTKMLIPLGGMLLIVIVILMVPALMQINI